jgi:hypothetical protein
MPPEAARSQKRRKTAAADTADPDSEKSVVDLSPPTPRAFGPEAWKASFRAFKREGQVYGGLSRAAGAMGMLPDNYRHHYKRWLRGEGFPTFTRGPPPQLGVKVEAELVAWIKELNRKGMPPGRAQVMAKARELAEALEIGGTFRGGDDWLRAFRRRYPELSLRSPQQVETARVTATSTKNLTSWLDNLEISRNLHMELTGVSSVNPERIWNMDECGISARGATSKVSCICGGPPTDHSVTCTQSPSSAGVRHQGGARLGAHNPPGLAPVLRRLRKCGRGDARALLHLPREARLQQLHGRLAGGPDHDDGQRVPGGVVVEHLGAGLRPADGREVHPHRRQPLHQAVLGGPPDLHRRGRHRRHPVPPHDPRGPALRRLLFQGIQEQDRRGDDGLGGEGGDGEQAHHRRGGEEGVGWRRHARLRPHQEGRVQRHGRGLQGDGHPPARQVQAPQPRDHQVTKLADELAAERATRAATLAAAEAQMGEDDGDEEEKEMDDKDDDGDEDCEAEVEADDDDAPLTEEERLKKAAKCLVLPPDTLANLRKFVGRRVPQTSVVLTGADSIKGLLEKEEKAEEVAADKQRKKLQRQVKKEVDGILSKPPSTWVATALPRRRGPTPLVPASTVNQWDTDRGKGVKVRLLYVDTENGGSAGSVRSTYNVTFRRAWKRLRDEASSDAVVVLPPAAETTEVPDDDDEL